MIPDRPGSQTIRLSSDTRLNSIQSEEVIRLVGGTLWNATVDVSVPIVAGGGGLADLAIDGDIHVGGAGLNLRGSIELNAEMLLAGGGSGFVRMHGSHLISGHATLRFD